MWYIAEIREAGAQTDSEIAGARRGKPRHLYRHRGISRMGRMEFRNGCPACEHTNPRLERELDALAQLLFDAYLEDCGIARDPTVAGAIDNAGDRDRLRGVDATDHSQI